MKKIKLISLIATILIVGGLITAKVYSSQFSSPSPLPPGQTMARIHISNVEAVADCVDKVYVHGTYNGGFTNYSLQPFDPDESVYYAVINGPGPQYLNAGLEYNSTEPCPDANGTIEYYEYNVGDYIDLWIYIDQY